MSCTRRPVLLAALLALLGPAEARSETLRVFAAASLSDAFTEIKAAFERGQPGVTVELSFAGSQILRTQIEQGAGADVFAAADREMMGALFAQGLVRRPRVFARNDLVVVTPFAEPKVLRLADLARPGTRLVLAAPSAPAGAYAARVLANLAEDGEHGDDFLRRANANVVSQETSVRAVLAKVILGEADAGLVYRTDAMDAAGKVRTIEIPAGANVVAEYAIAAVVRRGAAEASAAAFLELVAGEIGQEVLRRHGFQP